jgi:hypothetical protein
MRYAHLCGQEDGCSVLCTAQATRKRARAGDLPPEVKTLLRNYVGTKNSQVCQVPPVSWGSLGYSQGQ